ncbi:MAG: hypothetical protein LUQ65_05440, partial [Candidatus Helarchaeota archaeon]|nr:hypothetical protein [Candidatus Helarchaeota archaeon]
RGRTEILFSEDQNNILANFSYKAPFYCKFILIALFISFFALLMIQVVLLALDEFYHFNYGGWSLVVSLTSLCSVAVFGLAFTFLIAKYDSKRNILLPDQRIELISAAQTVQIAQDSSLISERGYSNKQDPLPDMYANIQIIYNAPKIATWKEKFLDLVKENSYLSKDQIFFNYLQLIKANRTFEVEFKWNQDILLLFMGFRPHNYFIVGTLGLLAGIPASLVLIKVFSLSLVFVIIPVLILIQFAVFLIWYLVSVAKYPLKGKTAAPEYITELQALASKAAEISRTLNT